MIRVYAFTLFYIKKPLIRRCETVAMVMGITLSATASVRVAYNGAVAGSEHNNRYVATGVVASLSPSL